ncbi:MAG: (2Fe-2S) ferredoxin domain-containing protein [Bdellovibrionales bacterium]|nr:(2Fe-2S) ferredoxin domain-containing protein [Oligoflexia bacterium]
MKTDAKGYDLHIFICTNDKKDACGDHGGAELVNKLKAWTKNEGLKGKVRINKSGCLGRCESAVACVAYPKGEWVVKAKPEDLEALQEWVKSML